MRVVTTDDDHPEVHAVNPVLAGSSYYELLYERCLT